MAEKLGTGLQNLLDGSVTRTRLQSVKNYLIFVLYHVRIIRKRSWTDESLVAAVNSSVSIREVLVALRLVPAGGNYEQIKARIKYLNLSTSHFTGSRWNKGKRYNLRTRTDISLLLTTTSYAQSYKLKKRLYEGGLKYPRCEICGWAEVSSDGRIPVELDHINGDRYDNRIENLRILCPNCHSLQPTHRGRNKKVARSNLTS